VLHEEKEKQTEARLSNYDQQTFGILFDVGSFDIGSFAVNSISTKAQRIKFKSSSSSFFLSFFLCSFYFKEKRKEEEQHIMPAFRKVLAVAEKNSIAKTVARILNNDQTPQGIGPGVSALSSFRPPISKKET